MAPAGAGKTAYLVDRARGLAARPGTMPRVVVATRLQVRAWQRRLAQAGGALGVHVGTFDRLYAQILSAAGEVYTRISDPIQYRLLRTLIGEAPLAYYALLRDAPGFVQEVARLIGEWKAGDREWADAAGTGWLAAEALEGHPQVGCDWPAVFVDGFDDLTTVQLRLLSGLAARVGELIVTLTGAPVGRPRETVHRRFYDTRDSVEATLGVRAELLPGLPERLGMMAKPLAVPEAPFRAPALAHLESMLYVNEDALPPLAEGALALVAAPDREGEVRAALRWLKRQAIEDGMSLCEVALLARDLAPYRAWIMQVAAEYGLPLHVIGGLPLRANPALAALLGLLRLPGGDAGQGSDADKGLGDVWVAGRGRRKAPSPLGGGLGWGHTCLLGRERACMGAIGRGAARGAGTAAGGPRCSSALGQVRALCAARDATGGPAELPGPRPLAGGVDR